jgi:hypothetical protein
MFPYACRTFKRGLIRNWLSLHKDLERFTDRQTNNYKNIEPWLDLYNYFYDICTLLKKLSDYN